MESSGIQSLEMGVGVFKLLYELGRPVALSELAAAASMHRAKLHRYLVSLMRTGLVAQDSDRRYRAGPYALKLIGDETALVRSRESALSALSELARTTGETVFISIWRGSRPLILHFEEPPKSISVRPAVNTEIPLLNSATGRAFAAFLPPEQLDRLLTAELKAMVPASQRAARRAAYLKELSAIRRRGIARSVAERYKSIVSLSAPLFGNRGNVLLAVTAFGLRESFDASWNGEVARTLRAWADEQAFLFQPAS